MIVWKLRHGADKRIRARHPWVFSNELSESPKGIAPGTPVQLQDAKGSFLAYGYGNPHSLIAFRALSYQPRESDIVTREGLLARVLRIWAQRQMIGYRNSCRLVYGEGDTVPGLVVDLYKVQQNGKSAQVLAVQILTAGMEFLTTNPEEFFKRLVTDAFEEKISDFSWDDTAVVLRNDVNVRKLEGLEYQDARVLKELSGWNLRDIEIAIDPAVGNDPLLMSTDLIDGQKTGFFLDQAFNIQILCEQIKRQSHVFESPVRVLDLCCYVGQWGTKIAQTLKSLGLEAEVTAVDASEKALAFAKRNIEAQGVVVIPKQLDVVHDLAALPQRHFDIVIADPPAFIKAKKDVPTGRHAYLKMNAAAFKLAAQGGLVVSCSCSGLFREEEMIETLNKAANRGEAWIRCLNKGGQAADHPVLMGFPEGFYLKMFLHQVIF